MDAYLIDTNSLKKIALINENVEDTIVRVIIQRVQRGVLRPILGTSLYKRLLQGVTNNDFNADESELMNDYIVPLLGVACDRKSINATTYDIRSKTTGKAGDEHITPVSESENLRLDNDIRQDLAVEISSIKGYLMDNQDNFPEYKSFICSFENIPPEQLKTGKINVNFI
jgi:hypothetical protein